MSGTNESSQADGETRNRTTDAEFYSPEFHLSVLDELVHEAETDGVVPLASDPDNRYPYAYPRDIASITRAWVAAIRSNHRETACRRNIVDAARFLLAVQDEDGHWQQRYALDGTDEGIYIQEDNTAHGLRVLSHAVTALDETDTLDDVEERFYERIREAVSDSLSVTRRELFDPNAHLIESTTSIHEGRIESGYTLWVNSAFVAALRQSREALEIAPVQADEVRTRIDDLLELLEGGLKRAFTSPAQVPRRYSPDGNIDDRPDVTLLAPYYFDLEDLFGDTAAAAAKRASEALEDPRLGGLQRFLGFYRDYEVQQHGGNGPWMQYTAWHAQFRYDTGDRERGDEALATIEQYADDSGHIPEHLTTRARFESFMQNEWHTRKDFDKEFDQAVLRDVPFDLVVEELQHMQAAYQRIADSVTNQDVVGFARPLAWSHAEVLTALLCRDAP